MHARSTDSLRVSVVMPVYNTEAYVELAVRSALASDLRELEVIVVDDGSQDRSAAIVAGIEDPRIVLLRLPRSGGPSRPRNAGIARARAPYVAFLDSDDLLRSDKLAAAVSALDQNPEAGFAFGGFESIDESGRVLQQSFTADYPVFRTLTRVPLSGDWALIPQSELARGLLCENFIGTSSVVVRRQLLTEAGAFDESIAYSEDRDLWFRLAHRCGALYRDRVGFSYRARSGSQTYGPQVRNARDRITVLQREKSRWAWTDRAARRQLNRRIAENLAGIGYEERGHRRLLAIAMFARAFMVSPQVRWLRGLLGSVAG